MDRVPSLNRFPSLFINNQKMYHKVTCSLLLPNLTFPTKNYVLPTSQFFVYRGTKVDVTLGSRPGRVRDGTGRKFIRDTDSVYCWRKSTVRCISLKTFVWRDRTTETGLGGSIGSAGPDRTGFTTGSPVTGSDTSTSTLSLRTVSVIYPDSRSPRTVSGDPLRTQGHVCLRSPGSPSVPVPPSRFSSLRQAASPRSGPYPPPHVASVRRRERPRPWPSTPVVPPRTHSTLTLSCL